MVNYLLVYGESLKPILHNQGFEALEALSKEQGENTIVI
jgi:hypothetical protein